MANVLLTGGTGLIGRSIISILLADQCQITVLTRSADKAQQYWHGKVTAVTELTQIPADQTFDIVINLAGAPIADARWSQQRKQVLEDSRIRLTDMLVQWLAKQQHKPQCLISGSAVGWYGDNGATLLDENSSFHDEYAHQLCEQWERDALKAQSMGIRVCIVRTGLVLAPDGGFLQRMLMPFKLGLGGRLASGQQYMPWIHVHDIARLFIFLAQNSTATGVFNGCAPNPVTNREFSATLAKLLHRPAIFPAPAAVLKVILGEMSQLLLGGQRAIPEKALKLGFNFEYTELHQALDATLNQRQ